MDDIRTKLLPTFLQEAGGNLPVIEAFLQKRAISDCDLVALDEACRAIHTLKGTAGLVRADSIRAIALRIEDVLEKHLQNKTSPTIIEYEALSLAQEKMTVLIDGLASASPEPPGLTDGVLQALDLAAAFPGKANSADLDSGTNSVADPFAEDENFDPQMTNGTGALTEQVNKPVSVSAAAGQGLPTDPFADDPLDLPGYGHRYADLPAALAENSSITMIEDPFADDPGLDTFAGSRESSGPAAVDRDTEEFSCCHFVLAGKQYSVPIESMVEISDLPDVLALPLSPPHIHGMVNLRGKVLPLIDLAGCEGVPSGPAMNRRMVVVGAQGEEFAFLCDGVPSLNAAFSGVRIDPAEFKDRYSIGTT